MKTLHYLAVLVASTLGPLSALGDPFLACSCVASGGGTSFGGRFSISCTVGQPVSGFVKADNVAMDQGFWAIAVPIPGSPRLTIARSGPNVILSWPSSATGFSIQSATNLNSPVWTPAAQPVVLSGSEFQVTVPASLEKQFFRLIEQSPFTHP